MIVEIFLIREIGISRSLVVGAPEGSGTVNAYSSHLAVFTAIIGGARRSNAS